MFRKHPLARLLDVAGSRRATVRAWSRLERKGTEGYERDLLATVRRLGAELTPIVSVTVSDGGLPAMRLQVPSGNLVLAGLAPRARDLAVELATTRRTFTLCDAGRYGRSWWISVSDRFGDVTALGSRLRWVPEGGVGERPPDDPEANRVDGAQLVSFT